MKRILIRAGTMPFDNYDATDVLISHYDKINYGNNLLGNNNGNLLYAYSVMRTIMKDEDIVVDADRYIYETRIVSDEEIERVNENYDVYILPLANAFRYKFRLPLQRLTNFINRIKIPVVLVGVGVGSKTDFERNKEGAYEFVKAILNKSAIVGVRGEITLSCLSELGFKPEEDVTAIGCPSAYTFGPTIRVREPKVNSFSKIILNDNIRSPEEVHQFICRTARKYRNAYFLPQMIDELRLMQLGISYEGKMEEVGSYPTELSHLYYKKDRARFFLNVPKWMDFVGTANFSIGSRMHGNVISVLSGTPSMFIVQDSRMKELVQYHKYPNVNKKNIDEKTTLARMVEKTDYSDFYKNQERNFQHYVDFLKKNNIPTIYDDGIIPKRGETVFDKKISEIYFLDGVKSINHCSKEEMLKRWDDYGIKEANSFSQLVTQLKNARASE